MMGNFCKFECAPYGRPGTDKILAGAIPILQNKRDIVLLGNHGVLVVGKTVTDAMNKTEAAEAIAKALLPDRSAGRRGSAVRRGMPVLPGSSEDQIRNFILVAYP